MSRQRLKLLLINSKKSISEMLSKLRQQSDEQHDFTFHGVSLSESGSLHATYSEKVEFSDETYDQFGNVIDEISYVTYRNISFHIEVLDTNKLLMVIYNSPKSMKSFLDCFTGLFDFQVGFSNPELNLKTFKGVLESDLNAKLEGTGKVKVSRVVIDKAAKASIEITSIKDAFESLEKLIEGKEYKLDKLSSSIYVDGHTVDFELSKLCSLRVRDEHLGCILPSIKSTLINQ
jgi:CRISPR/Cas system type I-B associated protein Csh2 (Cas7 group RAMP superfamily)